MARLCNAWPRQTCGRSTEHLTVCHCQSMHLPSTIRAHCRIAACPQTYLLKLSKSGEEGEKVFLVLESGTRFHTTQVIYLEAERRGLLRCWDQALGPTPKSCTSMSVTGSRCCASPCQVHQ